MHSTKITAKQIEAIRVNELWWITKTQMFDILLRGGWSVEEEQQFQVDYDRRYAKFNFLQFRERSLYDGSFHAAAGLELESYDDYDRAMRERQAHVVHLAGARQRVGIEDTEEVLKER